MTEALLLLARIGNVPPTLARTDLSLAVEETLEDLLPLAETAQIQMTAEFSEAFVEGDRVLLARLVGNLVHNAIAHNTPSRESLPRTIDISVHSDDDGVVLRICNTGAILDPHLVETLVSPFVRGERGSHSAHAGMGLGLAICQTIVRVHGGRFVLTAQPAGGLDVRITFPHSR